MNTLTKTSAVHVSELLMLVRVYFGVSLMLKIEWFWHMLAQKYNISDSTYS